MRVIGVDPGLRHTGWGVVEWRSGGLSHCAHGVIDTDAKASLGDRLLQLHSELSQILTDWQPMAAAMEQIFVNRNPTTTLKLAQARGVLLLAIAMRGIAFAEYTPNQVKKSVTGVGHAEKRQIHVMIGHLLPGSLVTSSDAADALGVAVTYLHRDYTVLGQRPIEAEGLRG